MRSYDLIKLYRKYRRQFKKIQSRLIKKGLTEEVTDVNRMSIHDFKFQIDLYKETRVKATGFTNKVRQLATSPFYARTIEEAINLRNVLEERGITSINGMPLTVENLRIFGLGALNDNLKEAGVESSYARRNYISYYVYDSY